MTVSALAFVNSLSSTPISNLPQLERSEQPSSSSPPSKPSFQIRRTALPSNESFNARSLGSPRPAGPRLELSPEVRARIEANRLARGKAAASAGHVLRRVGQRVGQGGRSDAGPGNRRGGRAGGARGRKSRDGGMKGDSETSTKYDAQIHALYAPPPRVTLEHTPEDLSLDQLRVDWPSIPAGEAGLVEGVTQKLRWMSRRMQHGYDAPQMLAERMQEGEMVHFESEEEKTETLEAAQEMAQERADRLSERRGEDVQAEVVAFSAVGTDDRQQLTAELVRGVYPRPAKKKHDFPFLDGVARTLDNNVSYHGKEKEQMLATIQTLLPKRKRREQPRIQ